MSVIGERDREGGTFSSVVLEAGEREGGPFRSIGLAACERVGGTFDQGISYPFPFHVMLCFRILNFKCYG